ncbi:MAG: sensor domain-containing diguanylate cyclase [Nitrospiraceae bacterium]|nr:MAG: sensor domain-containing diguanylate cyclase [Nitrospiraceae bacterium]
MKYEDSTDMRDSLTLRTELNYSKPLHLFLVTIVSIFLLVVIVMFVFPILAPSLNLREALLNASFLTLVIFPILYIFLLRPLQKQLIEMKEAKKAVLEIKHDWEDTFNSISDMVTIHDENFNIIRANKAAQKLLKLPNLDSVIGLKCYTYYHGSANPLSGCPSCNSFKTGEPCTFEIFEPHLNMFLEIRAIPRLDRNNLVKGLIHIVRDITARKQMEEKLKNLSLTDELTGLYNRRGFFALIEHHLKLARRHNKRLLLLYADLDNLKVINDTFGHQEGDRILKEASALLKATYRESDIVARIGGDEFVVFPVGSSEDNVEAIKLRLQKNIDNFNEALGRGYSMSISIGISCYDPSSPHSVDEMLAEADRLMYTCKKDRKGI